MQILDSASPTVLDTQFFHNTADTVGGGLMLSDSCNALFSGSDFFGNVARQGDGGAASMSQFSSCSFVNVRFRSNVAVSGGAVRVYGNTSSNFTGMPLHSWFYTLHSTLCTLQSGRPSSLISLSLSAPLSLFQTYPLSSSLALALQPYSSLLLARSLSLFSLATDGVARLPLRGKQRAGRRRNHCHQHGGANVLLVELHRQRCCRVRRRSEPVW